MKKFFQIFLAAIILFSANGIFFKAEAAQLNFQELKRKIALPVLPERIRYRNTRRGPAKIIFQPKEFPQRREVQPQKNYIQRQPKRPAVVYPPKRPTNHTGQRGSMPKKNFGPPKFRYSR